MSKLQKYIRLNDYGNLWVIITQEKVNGLVGDSGPPIYLKVSNDWESGIILSNTDEKDDVFG